MERLTKTNYRNLDPWECCGQDDYCQRKCHEKGGCANGCDVPKLYARLAAYEDTGLMPYEIKSAFTPDASIKLAAQALETTPERLRELAEADKDGRVVVLPCKVGDTVWRIVRDANPHITRDEVRDMYFADDMTLCVELVGGRITFTEKFGKTVFYTREEAERALEGSKDGN